MIITSLEIFRPISQISPGKREDASFSCFIEQARHTAFLIARLEAVAAE